MVSNQRAIHRYAVHGGAAWTAYAIVECWILSIIPWFEGSAYSYWPMHPGLTALLFVACPLFGVALGILVGLVIHTAAPALETRIQPPDDWIPKAAGAWTLIAAYTVIVFFLLPRASGVVVPLHVMNGLMLTVALILVGRFPNQLRRLRFVASPWFAAALLLGVPWLVKERLFMYSNAVKAAGAVGFWIAALATGLTAHRIGQGRRARLRREQQVGVQPRSLRLLATAAAVSLLFSISLDQKPYTSGNVPAAPRAGRNRPPVILIVLDTVRAAHLSVYGYSRETTPNLKKLSDDAMVYKHAIAASDHSLSAHASIFTGLYPSHHGVYFAPPDFSVPTPVGPQLRTLAEILLDAGYRTIGVVANHGFLNHAFGFSQGFQHFDQRVPVRFLAHLRGHYLREAARSVLAAGVNSPQADLAYRTAEEINGEVFQLLDEIHQEAFFLFINYMDAHSPYRPPPPFGTRFPGRHDQLVDWDRAAGPGAADVPLRHAIIPAVRRHIESQYDGAIAYLDSQLAALLARLKQLDLYDDSLIIITSDHGEAFGDKGLTGHGGVSVYQDQIHVPLIVKYPGRLRRGTSHDLVSHVDLLPTILEAAGLSRPAEAQGQSLLGPIEPDRSVISESFSTPFQSTLRPRRVERAWIAGRFKFISSTAGKRELYDLGNDKSEVQDLSAIYIDVAQALESSLDEWVSAATRRSPAPVLLDRHTTERLRSLGYIR